MDTWRGIKTAPVNEPVLVTDTYNDVYFGRFVEKVGGGTKFRGTDISDGISVEIVENILTGWQPAPDTEVKEEKTADEMFRELGLEESEFEDIYINRKDIRICVSNRTGIAKWTYDKYGKEVWIAFTPGEILACAQLIKEMEEHK